MKRIYFLANILVFLAVSIGATAQRVEVMDGNLDALKGTKKLNVKYDYSKMDVGKIQRKDYIEEKESSVLTTKKPAKGR